MPSLSRRKELEKLKQALQRLPPDVAQKRVSNKYKTRIAGTAQRDLPYTPPTLIEREHTSTDDKLIQMAKDKRLRKAKAK